MTTDKKPANPSLQKKSAARIATVQCLYTQTFHDTVPSTAQQVDRLKNRLKHNEGEQKLVVGRAIEPNYKMVEDLLEGIANNIDEINTRLNSVLSSEWKRERMSPVLIAILQCGIYELFFGKEVKPNIIMDEYSRITRSFFSDAEVGFVYGAFATLNQQYG